MACPTRTYRTQASSRSVSVEGEYSILQHMLLSVQVLTGPPVADRICPGRHFGLAAVYINVACALHAFDFSPPVDEHGREVKIEPRMVSGFVSWVLISCCSMEEVLI